MVRTPPGLLQGNGDAREVVREEGSVQEEKWSAEVVGGDGISPCKFAEPRSRSCAPGQEGGRACSPLAGVREERWGKPNGKERGAEGLSVILSERGGRFGALGMGRGKERAMASDWLGETVEERLLAPEHGLDASGWLGADGGR